MTASGGEIAILTAIIAAVALVLAAVITSRRGTRGQLSEIHVLVNSRLHDALDEIERLKVKVSDLEADAIVLKDHIVQDHLLETARKNGDLATD